MVGAGALGCAAARTLAQTAGIAVTLVDPDHVELSNLQRQVLYVEADIGRLKVEAAAERLARDFSRPVTAIAARFDLETGPALLEGADLVIDATDDPDTKFLLGRLCCAAGLPYVYGGVVRTGGQWMLVEPGVSACLECLFPARGPENSEGCSALGVLAPVAGFVGCMQAFSALTFLLAPERAHPGRLHVYELGGARTRRLDIKPDDDCFCRPVRATRARTHEAHRRTAP